MALFGKKSKAKSSNGLILVEDDEILAYLDEVFRKRISVSVTIKNRTTSADIMFMDLKTKTMRLQLEGIPSSAHGSDVMMGFSLDRTWWSAKSKLVFEEGKPLLLIPKAIKHSERRSEPRTSFTAREQVKVTVMEGIGSGHGVFGMATDVSPDGICLIIEKAMLLSNEREVPPSPSLFKPGTRLAFVKLNRVPGCQIIETQGIAKRLYRDGKWRLVIQLDKLSKTDRASISRFIEPRVLDFKYIKRSMKRREESDTRGGVGSALGDSSSSQTQSGSTASAAKSADAATRSNASSNTTAAPTPAQEKSSAGAASPAASTGEKTKVLLVGEELLNDLPFLEDADSPIEVFIGNTPVSLIRILSEENPSLVLCGAEFKGRSSLDILERIANMGLSEKRRVVVCADDLQGKARIRYKMLKINDFVDLPVKDKQDFYNQVLQA